MGGVDNDFEYGDAAETTTSAPQTQQYVQYFFIRVRKLSILKAPVIASVTEEVGGKTAMTDKNTWKRIWSSLKISLLMRMRIGGLRSSLLKQSKSYCNIIAQLISCAYSPFLSRSVSNRLFSAVEVSFKGRIDEKAEGVEHESSAVTSVLHDTPQKASPSVATFEYEIDENSLRSEDDEEKSDSFEDSYHPSQSVIDVEPAFRRSVPELAKRAGSSNQKEEEEEDGYGEDFDQSMVEEVEDEEEVDSFGDDDDDAHLPVYY